MGWALCFLVALLSPPTLAVGSATDETTADYVFVFLHGGEAEGVDAQQMQEVMAGHFANMSRLAEAGELLVAGPLGEPRSDPGHRGIFVFDVATVEEAEELASSDPAVAAGVLRAECLPVRAGTWLQRTSELERAATQDRVARGESADWVGRGYLLVSVDDLEAAREVLADEIDRGAVLLDYELREDREGEGILLLDVDEPGAGRKMVEEAEERSGRALGWSFHGWYGSPVLAHGPRMARHPAAPSFEILPVDRSTRADLHPAFTRRLDVFGLAIHGTETVPDLDLLRAAHVLAEVLDGDEDGEPDRPAVLQALVERGASLSLRTSEDATDPGEFDAAAAAAEGASPSETLVVSKGSESSSPRARLDGAVRAVLGLVAQGWALVHPEALGPEPGRRLVEALARAPERPSNEDSERAADAAWLKAIEPELAALLSDPRYRLPRHRPDGRYGD